MDDALFDKKRVFYLDNRQARALSFIVVLILYSLLVTIYLYPRNSIENLGFWGHINSGYRPNLSQLETLSTNKNDLMDMPLLINCRHEAH
jgi:hypothetical protein